MAENATTPAPSPRGVYGHFKKGNKLGTGNPLASKVEKLRARLLKAVTPEDFDAIAKKLIALSKNGDMTAMKEFFDRVLGKVKQPHEGTINVLLRTPDDRAAEAGAISDRLRAILNPARN